MTLHEELIAAGIETDHHESDLYFPATPETTTILERYPLHEKAAMVFVNQGDGTPGRWFDVPFAFDPFWKTRAKS